MQKGITPQNSGPSLSADMVLTRNSLGVTPAHLESWLYRFASLFEVDTIFKHWTANYKTANNKTNVRLKLKDWFFEKGSFWTTNSGTADKKTANNKGNLY
jgi:hypothetical protein